MYINNLCKLQVEVHLELELLSPDSQFSSLSATVHLNHCNCILLFTHVEKYITYWSKSFALAVVRPLPWTKNNHLSWVPWYHSEPERILLQAGTQNFEISIWKIIYRWPFVFQKSQMNKRWRPSIIINLSIELTKAIL